MYTQSAETGSDRIIDIDSRKIISPDIVNGEFTEFPVCISSLEAEILLIFQP